MSRGRVRWFDHVQCRPINDWVGKEQFGFRLRVVEAVKERHDRP